MSKIYVVSCILRNTNRENISDSNYFDEMIVQMFPTKDSATRWVEDNFARYIKFYPSFCDFKITEKELRFYDNSIPKDTILSWTWIAARLSENLDNIEILGFGKQKDEYCEYGYFSKLDNKYHIFARLPLRIKSRKEIIDYLELRASKIKK